MRMHACVLSRGSAKRSHAGPQACVRQCRASPHMRHISIHTCMRYRSADVPDVPSGPKWCPYTPEPRRRSGSALHCGCGYGAPSARREWTPVELLYHAKHVPAEFPVQLRPLLGPWHLRWLTQPNGQSQAMQLTLKCVPFEEMSAGQPDANP